MKRPYVVVALMACAVAAFAVLTGPAAAKKPKKPVVVNLPVVPGSQYLALGDSVPFGYMESTVVPAPNYHNPASFVGYPEMLAAELRLKVANAACSGETTSSFINPAAPSNGCENNAQKTAQNYRSLYPLHVSYKGSQLAYALAYLHGHHDVRLITLMIGGDDFRLCAATTKDLCQSSSEQATLAATLTKNLHTILSAIRTKGQYLGQIVFVNYYSPAPVLNAITIHLEGVVDAATKPFHVKIADGYGEFATAAAHSGGNNCTAGLLTQLSGGGCGIHPSYAGQALLAQAVEKAIKLG